MQKIAAVIPAFNAAGMLSPLIEAIHTSYPHLSVIVVDDGSTDNSGDVARWHGATVLSHETNRGKGAALRTGFTYALEHGFDAVVTLDADLQHAPEEIQRFLDEYFWDDLILIGVRQLGGGMPLERKISNSLSSFVASVVSGARISDSQCGFRLIPARVLRSINLQSTHYDLEPELLIRAVRAGFRVRGIPISTIYNDSPSSIRPARDTLRFLQMLVRSLFW